MSDIIRKPFSKAIEQRPGVTLRRLTDEDKQNYPHAIGGGGDNYVGVFNVYGKQKLLAILDFDDLFDERGNRFYND